MSGGVCATNSRSKEMVKIDIEVKALRYRLDVRAINTRSNSEFEAPDPERVNLLEKLVCILLNKRSMPDAQREIVIARAVK
jgi:hypothetical protein